MPELPTLQTIEAKPNFKRDIYYFMKPENWGDWSTAEDVADFKESLQKMTRKIWGKHLHFYQHNQKIAGNISEVNAEEIERQIASAIYP